MAQEKIYAVLHQPGTGYKLTIKDVSSLPSDLTAMIPTCYARSAVTYADPLALTITQPIEIIQVAALTGDVTINLTVSSDLIAGAELFLRFIADGVTATITFGTGIGTATAFTLATTKIAWVYLVYDGTAYQVISKYQTN